MTLHHYGSEFNLSSARELVPQILDLIPASSVIDVGCGLGTWARVFRDHGLAVKGLDGEHVPRERLYISESEFAVVDLRSPPRSVFKDFRYDLCISLEVAEHLPPECADDFVAFLCSCSDVIVFSAAIPGQTGENHLNEQPLGYWAEKFHNAGFEVFDPFRGANWNNAKIELWYRQNMLLAVANDRASEYVTCQKFDGNTYIHPECLEMYRTMQTARVSTMTVVSSLWDRMSRWRTSRAEAL